MCDIETEQTAMKRGAYAHSQAIVNHNHWVNNKAKKDLTYTNAMPLLDGDMKTYCRRRKRFEQYLFDELYNGNVYRVNQGKLSIVMASYNAPDALQKTLASLFANTYHEFELIIIDDVSTNYTTKAVLSDLIRKPYFNKDRS